MYQVYMVFFSVRKLSKNRSGVHFLSPIVLHFKYEF